MVNNIDGKVFAVARSVEKFNKKYEDSISEKLVFLRQDVNDPFDETLFRNVKVIVHAASYASPKYYGVDPVGTLSANTIGSFNLLKLASQLEIEAFLFISSSEVYGKPNNTPTSEDDLGLVDQMAVRSCYPESKRMGENMCVCWWKQFNVPIKIIRPFHVFGPGMDLEDGRVYADFVRSVILKKNIVLNSSGDAMRSFCYLSDALDGMLRVLCLGEIGKAYNVGNPAGEIAIRQLAKLILNMYPEKVPEIEFNNISQNGYIKSDIDRILPDVSRLKSLGWSPKYDLKSGFYRTIESYKNEDS